MPPQPSLVDYLFVCDGTTLFKVTNAGDVSNWGITPPANGFTAAVAAVSSKSIDNMEDPGAAARWSATSLTATANTTYFQEGAQSIRFEVAANTIGTAVQNKTIALDTFAAAGDSSSADYISFWLKIDNPDNLYWIQLDLSLGNTTFATDTYSFRIDKSGEKKTDANRRGLANSDTWNTEEAQRNSVEEASTAFVINNNRRTNNSNIYSSLGNEGFPVEAGVWEQIHVAKKQFAKSGGGAVDWGDVQAVKFTLKTKETGAIYTYIDDLKMVGGCGLQGTYRYLVTFRNSVTGSRSNSNSSYVEVLNVLRQPISLAALPTSSDTQVDQLEIWRTIGNGSLFFRIARIAEGTLTYTDRVADVVALDDSAAATYISSEELPTDNTIPESTFNIACGPYNTSMFWLNSLAGTRGRIYYSPIGRPESVEGYLEVTSDDDPLLSMVMWNGNLIAFSESKAYQIYGTNPYGYREVFGIPGVSETNAGTVMSGPKGIVYQAVDCVRLFAGAQSNKINPEAIEVLFQGENASNLTAFEGTVAAIKGNNYYISDGTQTLAVNFETGTWRDLGIGFDALYYEPDTKLLIGSYGSKVVVVEDAGAVTDAGTAIPFEIETFHSSRVGDILNVSSFLEIDADLNDQVLNVYLLLDDAVESLGSITNSSRSYMQIPVNKQSRRVGVRLTGSLTNAIEIFKIILEEDVGYKKRS
jgi:hypothetical protein